MRQRASLTEFGDALEDLIRAVSKASGRGVPGGETELTLSQYFVMDAMADEALTVSEVARAARVAVPTATRALAALETRGFVDRERNDEEDRRLVTVALTPQRAQRARREAHLGRQRQREIFDGLRRRARTVGRARRLARYRRALAGAAPDPRVWQGRGALGEPPMTAFRRT